MEDRDNQTKWITRFAPSPTGYLHLGHAYSALYSYQKCKEADGKFLIRIEDIDFTRCKPEYEDAIFEDLEWLGIKWEHEVIRQSERHDTYLKQINLLHQRELLYPCFCTRKEIEELTVPNHTDLYPGTCKKLSPSEIEDKIAQGIPYSLRLNIDSVQKQLTTPLNWIDLQTGEQRVDPTNMDDVILSRKDIHTSYHIAVTTDDAIQQVTHVVRGKDLYDSTPIHRVLQELQGYPTPVYDHHKLIENVAGEKLSKRDHSTPLRELRENCVSADQIIEELGFE